jgi:hypothetical protein
MRTSTSCSLRRWSGSANSAAWSPSSSISANSYSAPQDMGGGLGTRAEESPRIWSGEVARDFARFGTDAHYPGPSLKAGVVPHPLQVPEAAASVDATRVTNTSSESMTTVEGVKDLGIYAPQYREP